MNAEKETIKLIIQIVFLVLLAGAIISLIVTTMVLLKNKEIISKDPLIYGMRVHNFTNCQCFDIYGKEWYSTEFGFIHEEKGEGWINYSSQEYRINLSKIGVIENGDG